MCGFLRFNDAKKTIYLFNVIRILLCVVFAVLMIILEKYCDEQRMQTVRLN